MKTKIQVARREAELKSALLAEMKLIVPSYVVQTHENVRRSGQPDWSVTAHGRDSWLEFKHGTPHFDSQGLQELTMLRLAAAGFARYVIWQENADGTGKRTMIVHPKNIGDLGPEEWRVGFDNRFIIEYLRKRHRP